MSAHYRLRCPGCGSSRIGACDPTICPDCDAPMIVAMDLSGIEWPTAAEDRSMWRFFDLLPLANPRSIVSQGEGGTPLLEAPRLAEKLGLDRLLLKNETTNPTGSFKDRQVSLSISRALESGVRTVAVISSGNVAASAASYAARAGIGCRVFTPDNAPERRLIQSRIHGASWYRVETASSSRVFELLAGVCRQNGWHLLSTAGLYNAHHVEGAKTIAYELHEQADPLPDRVVVPVGGGGLLGAIWRGFEELKTLGRCDRIPALVGVQSVACAPLVRAIERDLSPAEVIADPVSVGDTIAGAIADDILFDAYTALPAIRETGGLALAVTDEELLTAEHLLARQAGLFCEPASAATLAGVLRLRESGLLVERESVCCVITGGGLKDLDAAAGLVEAPRTLHASDEGFRELLHEGGSTG